MNRMKSLQMSKAEKARHKYHCEATRERDLRIVELVGLRSKTAVLNVLRRMEAAGDPAERTK